MESRKPQPLVLALAVLLPVLLVLGVWLGGHPKDLPGFARKAFVANHETVALDEAIERVANDYYRPVSRSNLANASIAGMIFEPARPLLDLSQPQGIHHVRPAGELRRDRGRDRPEVAGP